MPPKQYKVARRRRRRQKAGKFWNTAEKALSTALQVKRLINVEFKVHDIPETSTSVGNSGLLVALNSMGSGDGASDRNGLSVLNKTLQFKYYATQHEHARDTFVRIVLILDKSPHGTLTTVDHIYSENRITGHLNKAHMARYQILSEQLIALNSSSTDYNIGKKYHELNFHTKYEEGAAVDHNVEKNQLLLYMISNEATNTPTIHWSTRLRYIDN